VRFAIPLALASALALAPILPAQGDGAAAPAERRPLFNKRNLEGLRIWLKDSRHEDPRQVFSVTNGQLRVSGDALGYLAAEGRHRDYRVALEYRWGTAQSAWGDRVGKARDSGLFLHATGPDGSSHDGGGAFKAALECNIFQGATGDFLLIRGDDAEGRLIAPRLAVQTAPGLDADGWPTWSKGGPLKTLERWGRVNGFAKSAQWQDVADFRGDRDAEHPRGEWNLLECVSVGDRVAVFLNGMLVNEASQVWPGEGEILLQCEGSEIFVRRWELLPPERELSELPPPGQRVAIGLGKLFIPTHLAHDAKGSVPLLLFLHGDPTVVERNAARAGFRGAVVSVVRPGLSSAYAEPFRDPAAFWKLLAEAEAQLRASAKDDSLAIGPLICASFSAGFGGVREFLKDPAIAARIDTLVMADSLYAGYDEGTTIPARDKMEGFLKFAQTAAAGEKRFVLSHSEQPAPGYASTTETANHIAAQIHLAPRPALEAWPAALHPTRQLHRGGLEILGFKGNGPGDHMEHLRSFWTLLEYALAPAPSPIPHEPRNR